LALAGTGLELVVRELATLRPHEETIPTHVELMVRSLSNDGMQKDPIMIDGRSGTVLDGMHRLAAFASLGFDRAVCCSLDYESEKVTIGRWARVYVTEERDQQRKVFESEGFTVPMGVKKAMAALEERTVGVAVAFGNDAFAQQSGSSLAEAFGTVERIDQLSSERGWKRSFVREEEIEEQVMKGDRAVVLVQKLLKRDVLDAAKSRKLFPCKTSMHTIDPRPVAVNFPLADLMEEEGEEELLERLARRRARLLPAGSLYEGRRYKERLLLLNPA
jgi:hypothetical protein